MMGNDSTEPLDTVQECELTAVKFSKVGKLGKSTAIDFVRPSSPEFPLAARTIVAYPMRKLLKQESIAICIKQKPIVQDGKVWYLRVLRDGDPSIMVIKPTLFYFTNGFSHDANNAGFFCARMETQTIFGKQKDHALGHYVVVLNWQITHDCLDEQSWKELKIENNTFHFYLTLDVPNYPWTYQAKPLQFAAITHAPNVVLLYRAIMMARGEGKKNDVVDPIKAAQGITQRISSLGFQYTIESAYATPVHGQDGFLFFDLTAFSEHLLGMYGLGWMANCTDLSHFVMLLGNIIGCGINVAKLSHPTLPTFSINPIVPLNNPNISVSSFAYHEIAFIGRTLKPDSPVFDPCFVFKGKTESDPNIPVLGMSFDEYLDRLTGGLKTNCQPVVDYHPQILMI